MTLQSARGDRGAGGILVLAAVAVLGVTGLLGVTVTRALTIRHEVAAAADLAALAAAAVQGVTPPEPGQCGAAERVAAANAVELVGCAVEGGTVRVEVVRHVRWVGVASTVRGAARAGISCAARPDLR
ncbi:Rv3654c family TadE-like protein [Sporichthya sp.]|uniref:Rv3654c family TadE-like protein n=1 Tax=Sporichthya sp. TaxID=65475 RepID=UPI0017EBC96E|nr:Rv3654c family TadE-like protein [Sporichthya sp.]MBA3745861.1 hypothetical protein [Sporichthya sp.]